jgi:hypothetical protein
MSFTGEGYRVVFALAKDADGLPLNLDHAEWMPHRTMPNPDLAAQVVASMVAQDRQNGKYVWGTQHATVTTELDPVEWTRDPDCPAKLLLVSRGDEQAGLGNLPARVPLPPMPAPTAACWSGPSPQRTRHLADLGPASPVLGVRRSRPGCRSCPG